MKPLCCCDVCTNGRGWLCLGCASFYQSCPDHDAENCPACGEKVCPVDVLTRAVPFEESRTELIKAPVEVRSGLRCTCLETGMENCKAQVHDAKHEDLVEVRLVPAGFEACTFNEATKSTVGYGLGINSNGHFMFWVPVSTGITWLRPVLPPEPIDATRLAVLLRGVDREDLTMQDWTDAVLRALTQMGLVAK